MNKLNIIFLFFAALLFTACDLERIPFTDLENTESFKTLKDAAKHNNGLYAQMRDRVYGGDMFLPDIQSDLLHASLVCEDASSVYRWNFIDNDENIASVWAGCYKAIANVNNFLDNAHLIEVETDSEKSQLENYIGEAYFFRAFYYEKLIKRYARDYEPETAAADPGVPLSLHFDLKAELPRASVSEVYEQILADLDSAQAKISLAGYQGAIRVSKDCATALRARVYLTMHRYGDAVAEADKLISRKIYRIVSTVKDLTDVWHKDDIKESILMLMCIKDTEKAATNGIFWSYYYVTKEYTPYYLPEKWVVDLYDEADIRKQVYLSKPLIKIDGKTYNDVYLINKYPGNPLLVMDTLNSNFQHKPKVFRIAEAHLIKAEALAWSGKDAESLAALNVLRTARGLTALTNISGEALKQEIRNERTREFLCEGVRLDDLKRWKMGVVRGEPQEASIVTLGSDADALNRPAGDNKMVWAIPSRDLIANPALKGSQNPGW
ncbi:MAG: RagB/SusD family nutrient uptake outer membrane protein [Dysgonamonadaceae bacterium]|jgi:hypothetical protein|nr:RagB/SusD family nutrient uptake outer membrane protein [Dysgonamonadaceae bacterium]